MTQTGAHEYVSPEDTWLRNRSARGRADFLYVSSNSHPPTQQVEIHLLT